jgi:hypothetical protein
MPASADPLPMQVDHIVATQHLGKTRLANLALICAYCNRHKGPNLAGIDRRTGKLTRLFNPRADERRDHFQWRQATLLGLSPVGRVTIQVLAINAEERIAARAALIAEGLARELT